MAETDLFCATFLDALAMYAAKVLDLAEVLDDCRDELLAVVKQLVAELQQKGLPHAAVAHLVQAAERRVARMDVATGH